MYKLLLSWRYLLTRYLALASIISVMLGVATLIVVNSVMSGFATKLRDRMRGIQAHVVVDSRSADGFSDYEGKIRQVRELLGDKIEAISPVIEAYAMLQYKFRKYNRDGDLIGESEPLTRLVRLIGIDPTGKSETGEFKEYLQVPAHREDPARAFELSGEAAEHYWKNQRWKSQVTTWRGGANRRPAGDTEPPPTEPFEAPPESRRIFGAVVGYGIATFRNPQARADDPNKDEVVLRLGDEVTLVTMSRTDLEGHDGTRGYPRPVVANFAVTDIFRSEMSEIDSNLIYVDLADMQRLRTMQGRATSLQIKLKDYDRDAREVVEVLSRQFHPMFFMVQTWENKQGPLLAAIAIERAILNVLLFLIIAVAGFGILAIFFMIVVEKTRDIGILKALGASNTGVMGIFLSYGLALGLVGAGLGTLLGVTLTVYINEFEKLLARITGQDVFPRDVYYFDQIPTDMQATSILLVNLGAVLIAVGASVFPSFRAALLHPVRALRYDQ